MLEAFGLKKALFSFYNSIAISKKPKLELEKYSVPKGLAKNTEVILYRILSELINNTLKHAEASKISINIFEHFGQLELHYNDDGCGFDPKENRRKGNGLANISSRVKSLDGKVNVYSKKNDGFYMKINIPL